MSAMTIIEVILSNTLAAAALALFALLITRIWRNPHLAHALWILVLIKLVTPPLIEIPVHLLSDPAGLSTPVTEALITPHEGTESTTVAPDRAPAFPASAVSPWPRALTAIWLMGLLATLAFAWRRHRRLNFILQHAHQADLTLLSETAALAARIGVSRSPRVLVTPARISPLVTMGLREPTILLPEQLLENLDTAERRSVIAHELAHLRRRDRWYRLFNLLALALHWWNPVAWWAGRRLHHATEECCDAMVVETLPESRSSYGSALLRTLDFLSSEPAEGSLPAPSFGAPFFKQRIQSIMKNKTHHRMTHLVRASVLLLGMATLPFSLTADSKSELGASSDPDLGEIGGTSRPVTWKKFEFSLEEANEEMDAKLRKLAREKEISTLDDYLSLLRELEVMVYSLRESTLAESDVPEAVRSAAAGLGLNEMSEPIRHGNTYRVFGKTVDRKAEERERKARQAARERKAQRRILELDVKAAELRAVAASEKAARVAELAKSSITSSIEVRETQLAADLAYVEVERAKAAVELFDAQNDLPAGD